jgi:3-isopropylmalate/(R)-2-methylmalate dehydratase small subunit
VQIDCEGTPKVKNAQGQVLTCHAVPSFLMDMVNADGLVNVLKQRMADKAHNKTH